MSTVMIFSTALGPSPMAAVRASLRAHYAPWAPTIKRAIKTIKTTVKVYGIFKITKIIETKYAKYFFECVLSIELSNFKNGCNPLATTNNLPITQDKRINKQRLREKKHVKWSVVNPSWPKVRNGSANICSKFQIDFGHFRFTASVLTHTLNVYIYILYILFQLFNFFKFDISITTFIKNLCIFHALPD